MIARRALLFAYALTCLLIGLCFSAIWWTDTWLVIKLLVSIPIPFCLYGAFLCGRAMIFRKRLKEFQDGDNGEITSIVELLVDALHLIRW